MIDVRNIVIISVIIINIILIPYSPPMLQTGDLQ